MASLFTIKLNHGGALTDKWEYVGGEVHYWDNVDPDNLSFFEFIDMLKEEGVEYNSKSTFYYSLPGLDLKTGLVKVYKDVEVLDMCEIGMKNGMVKVFVVHDVDVPEVIPQIECGSTGPNPTNDQVDEAQPNIEEPQPNTHTEAHPITQATTDKIPPKAARKKMSARKRVASSKKVKGTRPKTTEPIPQTNEEETQPTQHSPQTSDSEPQPTQPTSQIIELEHNPTQPTLEPTSQADPKPQVTQPTSQIIDPKPQGSQPLDNWWNDDSVDDDYDATMDLSNDDSLGGCDWIVEEDDIDLSCSSIDVSDGSVDEDYGGGESEPTRSSSDEELLDSRRKRKVLNRFGVKLSKWNCYRVKKHAHRLLHRNLKDRYSKIAAYLNELKRVDEDFRFQLQTDVLENDAEHVEQQFKRLYISFPGLRAGFISGCRKVVCIDGCFLKTFLGGQLLCAISRDGNNQMFPICWAVVDAENNEAWEWFLENLKKDLPGFGGEDCTIISDQHKSIMHGVKTIFPDVEHRNCARHIWPPWHKKHRGDSSKEKFWQAVYAYNMADFDLALQEMAVLCTTTVEDFKALKPKTFCRFGFRIHTKCNLVVNNLAETFNGWILESRSKPILGMLEDIRRVVMERLFLKRTLMERAKDDICPRIRKKLEQTRNMLRPVMFLHLIKWSLKCYVVWSF
ncbi:uncharacterized protein LOC125492820 [Beta vulgaris subsp. vulgaris]|uniref:uncharacterized protein LOC125492820 n=1 Tax=Beta vulgaris subsp. vulgaris TaxID=3555 RepID=UPI002549BBF8|nr:uncharacterized protein LOC125492820 [Beta vulgaris subsp. vulgaris]